MPWRRAGRSYHSTSQVAEPLEGPIIGGKLVGDTDQFGMKIHWGIPRWRTTTRLKDLDLPDSEFVGCTSYEEMIEKLRERFPSDVLGARRVLKIKPDKRGWHPNTAGDEPHRDALVLPMPLLDDLIYSNVQTSRGWEKVLVPDALAKVTEYVTLNGDMVISEIGEDAVRKQPTFFDSNLVIGKAYKVAGDKAFHEIGDGFTVVKFAPGKARSRKTRDANISREATATNYTANQRARFTYASVRAFRAVREDFLKREGIKTEPQKPRGIELVLRDVAGFGGSVMATLMAFCNLHTRLYGEFEYRKVPEIREVLAAYYGLPAVNPPYADVGLDDVALAWVRAEIADLPIYPRLEKPKPTEKPAKAPQPAQDASNGVKTTETTTQAAPATQEATQEVL